MYWIQIWPLCLVDEPALRGETSATIKRTSAFLKTEHISISDQHVRMCATIIPKVPAAMREVLAVGGRMGDRQKGGWGYCRQHSAPFFFPLPLLFREPWLQAGACAFSGSRECEVCVRLSPGCTWGWRALPLTNNSPAFAWGRVGCKEIRRWKVSGAEMGGYLQ